MTHLISEDMLQRFARGAATREEGRTVLGHLLRGCAVCSRTLQAFVEPAAMTRDGGEAPGRFGGPLPGPLQGPSVTKRPLRAPN
jgi:hypothetical protein